MKAPPVWRRMRSNQWPYVTYERSNHKPEQQPLWMLSGPSFGKGAGFSQGLPRGKKNQEPATSSAGPGWKRKTLTLPVQRAEWTRPGWKLGTIPSHHTAPRVVTGPIPETGRSPLITPIPSKSAPILYYLLWKWCLVYTQTFENYFVEILKKNLLFVGPTSLGHLRRGNLGTPTPPGGNFDRRER